MMSHVFPRWRDHDPVHAVVGVERDAGGFARGHCTIEHRERSGLLLHVEGNVGQVGADGGCRGVRFLAMTCFFHVGF